HGEYVVLTRTPSRVTVTEPDVTPPSITATAPATSAYINSITTSSDVSYALSEAIQSGTIVFTRTGGTADATTHTCTLTGTALNTGSHSNLNLSDTTNACTAAQSLVSGTIYTVTFNATDLAGNPATQVSNTGVTFDSTAPTITSTAPATSAYINSITTSSDVSYALSEAIQSGTIVFTRTGGTADATTHTCTLTGTALNTGSHSNLNLSDTTNACTAAQSLVSGTIYTVTFNATDLAGNPATQVSNTGVTFDSTPPEAAESAAVTAIASDNTPSYTFSSTEAGTIAYSGGCTSATTAAISGSNTITFNELTRGNDYNCTVRITDAAGNQSAILNITEFAVTYRGDLDNNRAVNSNDFTTFADDYGETSWCGHTTDIDGNCIVNSNDFTILATDYGISF
ncbi:MAG TPA: Ig-like domain-containing protein, partial [Candidatus Moranbacteria bacterium]|nr:Ig-like domain-containing protein [Candidatus Moranbacteria bacterium]